MRSRFCLLYGIALALGTARMAWAANEGQATLDKAAEKNTDIKNLQDIGEVIKLTERSDERRPGCAEHRVRKNLLSSTLAQRGTKLAEIAVKEFGTGLRRTNGCSFAEWRCRIWKRRRDG